jgi:hypothetical protein
VHRQALPDRGLSVPSGVRVEGLTQAVRALQGYGVEIADLKAAFAAISGEGARLASSFAPVRTGTLARSVRGNKAKNKAVVLAGRARVPYAGAINYGWPARDIGKTLFMQRADQQLQPDAVRLLEEGLDEAARKAGLT